MANKPHLVSNVFTRNKNNIALQSWTQKMAVIHFGHYRCLLLPRHCRLHWRWAAGPPPSSLLVELSIGKLTMKN